MRNGASAAIQNQRCLSASADEVRNGLTFAGKYSTRLKCAEAQARMGCAMGQAGERKMFHVKHSFVFLHQASPYRSFSNRSRCFATKRYVSAHSSIVARASRRS